MTTSKLLTEALTEEGVEGTLVEEVGTIVFQSAIMYYFASHTETQIDDFEIFVNENVTNTSFVDDLCAEFPEFKDVLLMEMRAFEEDCV
jgi:hypothetical protein